MVSRRYLPSVYRKVVVAQGSLVPGRKVTGSVGNLSSLASYFVLVYT